MKKIINFVLAVFLLANFLTAPALVRAETTTTDETSALAVLLQTIELLKAQIADLQVKIAALQQAKAEVKEAKKEVKETLQITKQLSKGMSGEDVRILQETLATDPDIYPEGLVTGYYGKLTEKAVKKFQEKMGVEQVGQVGPKTTSKINELLTEGAGNSGKVPPGLLIAPGIRKKIGYTPVPPAGQVLPPGIAKKIIPTTPEEPEEPDTKAPVISDVLAGSITESSAVVSWTTDESATAKVYYGTSTPLVVNSTTAMVSRSSLALSHSLTLSSLNISTTYHYLAVSTDGSGNTATSSQHSFTTASAPDVTAPVISNLSAIASSTSVVITWTTDESAGSSVYYATSSPVTSSSNVIHRDGGGLLLTHSIGLLGLNASTTYYYLASSMDSASNRATSTEQSFNTLP